LYCDFSTGQQALLPLSWQGLFSATGAVALNEFQAGKRLNLTMCGCRQPKTGCQSKKNVSKMPHASIDTETEKNVQ
jgi:hypothetical protein